MKKITRTTTAFITAFFVLLAVSPSSALEGDETKNSANFAGWFSSAIENRVLDELSGELVLNVEKVKALIPSRFKSPQKFDSLDIAIPAQNRMGDMMFVNVTFMSGGRAVSRVNIPVTVKATMEVVVASRNIKKGAIINEDSLALERRAVGRGYKKYLSDFSAIVGLSATRNIRATSPMKADYVARPAVVRSGDMVTVVAQAGSMRITTRGHAKQDGNIGEWIQVVNLESRKIISARVSAPGEVTVEF
ncbi:hypothetical protein MNBD_NITROSPINAE01-1910 [hydrothermal vent metagenome]|uniref:SAF domain-containing protein n=1 Tax=hydrothermal vent metagenome TaxID=652676 RepID=A0A3B1BZ29_9ZZZZ